MAHFEAVIIVPPAPKQLTVRLPTAKRGSPTPLSAFTSEQLDEVVAEWGEKLKAEAASQREAQRSASKPAGRAARTEARAGGVT